MADNLLDNYNPLYDIHLRQYFALPHMQKHLQKMGLLESTLNLNGDEVYARHHAMMDMMLKNREAQLVKMAEIRKKLDAAEKVEICRRIRTGQSPTSYRRGKPSRSLSRSRANQNGGRQRRFSNSYEDREFVQNIEERNADPEDYDTKDPYKRLSANAKRFNYLHKLDDKTLIAYKDNLKQQLQRLERFREISFGPHSVARQPPPPQASWFFRRRSLPSLTASAPGNTLKEPLRSVLNMRGRKATTGNKLNASHDSRTSCPPTTRKRKDSNTRLPPINPKGRVPTKPPAPLSLQQTTTKLPPAAKKPAPTRGRPSNKRQTTTTTTTTITAVSKSPQSPTTLPVLPSITGHGIFTGAAAAATAAAVGTAAITVNELISDEPEKSPTPPYSPVLETQKTFDRSSPVEQLPSEVLDTLVHESEQNDDNNDDINDDFVDREVVLDSAPIDHSHGDYNSDSDPEYAEEDREPSPEETFTRHDVHITQTAATPLAVEAEQISSPISVKTEDNFSAEHDEKKSPANSEVDLPSPVETTDPEVLSETVPSEVERPHSRHSEVASPIEQLPSPASSTLEKDEIIAQAVVSELETEQTPVSPIKSDSPAAHSPISERMSPIADAQKSEHVEEHFEREHHEDLQSSHHEEFRQHDEKPASPIEVTELIEDHVESQKSPELSVHSSHAAEHFDDHDAVPQSPVLSVHGDHLQNDFASESPVLSVHTDDHDEQVHETSHSPLEKEPIQEVAAPSPVPSNHSAEVTEQPASPALSTHSSHVSQQIEQKISELHSPSQDDAHFPSTEHSQLIIDVHSPPHSPVLSANDSHLSEHVVQNTSDDVLPADVQGSEEFDHPVAEEESSVSQTISEADGHHSPVVQSTEQLEQEKSEFVPRSPSVHTSDASDHEHDEVVEEHHDDLAQNSGMIDDVHLKSEHATELYNPSNGNMESPETSDIEQDAAIESPIVAPASPASHEIPSQFDSSPEQEQGMTIADRIDLEAYHNSPTKESTSPVAPNPIQSHITAEEVAKQFTSPDASENFENIINQSADHEASHLISEALSEAPAIIEMVNNFQDQYEPSEEVVHPPEAYEINYDKDGTQHVDEMTTSVYQPSSDHGGSQSSIEALPETTTKIKEWDNGDEHIKETVTRSEFSSGNTHQTYSETVTVITDKSNSPGGRTSPINASSPNGNSDNISTDSLILHDDNMTGDQQMTQSVYKPKEEIEEKEWDEGNSHIHEVVSNVEHSDETGRHYTETVTTTTTVIKSGDDLENNNDETEEEHSDDEMMKSTIHEEEELHGSNGNSISESFTTTTNQVVTRGLPDGGILVDDGDETNVSSL